MLEASAEDARRFLVARQLLAPPRTLEGGTKAVLDFLRRFGSIQFDPIDVAGRSHDLVLHARVAGYEPGWCESLYERRKIFEAYNKGLSFVLAEDFRWFRAPLSNNSARILADNAAVAERVFERIRAEGPLSSLDFEPGRGAETDWFGVPTNVVRAVLEAAAAEGKLGLARREGGRRYYDLLERLLPAETLASEVPLRDRLRHKLLSRHRAHGLLSASSGADIFSGLGPARPDPERPELPGRRVLHEELVEEGELIGVSVDGVRGVRYVLSAEAELLTAPPEPPASVAFLSPFDPLVWDRKLLGELFGFDYVWELFIPPAKRRWGWYVLPIVFGDRLVGRIEPRIARDDGSVQVLNVWWEERFAPARVDGFVDAMRDALRAYLQLAGVARVDWPARLTKERRLFGIATTGGG